MKEQWDNKYCYPNSNVLKNKMGITRETDLFDAERQITSLQILRLKNQPIVGRFDFKHLKDIHKQLFGNIYDWAGKVRTVDISKGELFCLSQNIDMYANEIFAKLKAEKYLSETPEDEIVGRLSYFFGEINALHPFREGNGRTQRVFTEYLAAVAGYHLDFSKITPEEMINASIKSFYRDYSDMNEIIKKSISALSLSERKRYLALFGSRLPSLKSLSERLQYK